jgi:hypothetical protein
MISTPHRETAIALIDDAIQIHAAYDSLNEGYQNWYGFCDRG